jgi:hypothetical protein
VVDLSSILPASPITPLSKQMVAFHIERFQDRFFTHPPSWFTLYMYLEAFYHVPISFWMVWGIWTGEFNSGRICPSFFAAEERGRTMKAGEPHGLFDVRKSIKKSNLLPCRLPEFSFPLS